MSRPKRVERRARARRKRFLVYGIIGTLLALSLTAIVVFRNGDDFAPLPDNLKKSKGDPAAPVIVEEYGDFQ